MILDLVDNDASLRDCNVFTCPTSSWSQPAFSERHSKPHPYARGLHRVPGGHLGKRTKKQTYKWTNKQTNKQTDKRTNKQTKTSTQINKQTNKNLKNKQGAHENKQIGPLTILAGILLDPTHSQSTEVAS